MHRVEVCGEHQGLNVLLDSCLGRKRVGILIRSDWHHNVFILPSYRIEQFSGSIGWVAIQMHKQLIPFH